MRVLHLVDNLYIHSGITRHLLILSKSEPHGNFVCSIREDGAGKNFDKYGILNLTNKKLSNPIYAFFYLVKFCKDKQIDIVHTHHRYFDLLMWILNFFCKQKTVCTVHSIVKGKKLFSYKSRNLVAVSNSVKKHLINYFRITPDRITVNYNAVDSGIYKSDLISKQTNITSQSFKIGFFGKISIAEKGIDVLLKAIRQINESSKIEYKLIIVGNGVDEEFVEDYVKSHKLNCKIIDSQPNLSVYYANLNCYVLPSNVDPFPYAMLESAYYKVPFIGSNVDGISEYIENNTNGLLFDKGNVDELVQKILFIYNNPTEAKKLAKRNYMKVTSQFVFNSENQIYNVYKKVLSE